MQALPQCILVNVVQDVSMVTLPLGSYRLQRVCDQIKHHDENVVQHKNAGASVPTSFP